MKEKVLFLLTSFSGDTDTQMIFIFLNSFCNWVRNKYLSSTLVPRSGTISMKNVLKMLAISYSFLVFDLTLFEKRDFMVPQNFILSV